MNTFFLVGIMNYMARLLLMPATRETITFAPSSVTGFFHEELVGPGAGARFEMIVPQGIFRTKIIDTL